MLQIHLHKERPTSDGAKRRPEHYFRLGFPLENYSIISCKPPLGVVTQLSIYSEDLLAGASGFFPSALVGFSMLKSRLSVIDSVLLLISHC